MELDQASTIEGISVDDLNLSPEEHKTYLRWYMDLLVRKGKETIAMTDILAFVDNFGLKDSDKQKIIDLFGGPIAAFDPAKFYAFIRLTSHVLQDRPLSHALIFAQSLVPKPRSILSRKRKSDSHSPNLAGSPNLNASSGPGNPFRRQTAPAADHPSRPKKLDIDSFTTFILTGTRPASDEESDHPPPTSRRKKRVTFDSAPPEVAEAAARSMDELMRQRGLDQQQQAGPSLYYTDMSSSSAPEPTYGYEHEEDDDDVEDVEISSTFKNVNIDSVLYHGVSNVTRVEAEDHFQFTDGISPSPSPPVPSIASMQMGGSGRVSPQVYPPPPPPPRSRAGSMGADSLRPPIATYPHQTNYDQRHQPLTSHSTGLGQQPLASQSTGGLGQPLATHSTGGLGHQPLLSHSTGGLGQQPLASHSTGGLGHQTLASHSTGLGHQTLATHSTGLGSHPTGQPLTVHNTGGLGQSLNVQSTGLLQPTLAHNAGLHQPSTGPPAHQSSLGGLGLGLPSNPTGRLSPGFHQSGSLSPAFGLSHSGSSASLSTLPTGHSSFSPLPPSSPLMSAPPTTSSTPVQYTRPVPPPPQRVVSDVGRIPPPPLPPSRSVSVSMAQSESMRPVPPPPPSRRRAPSLPARSFSPMPPMRPGQSLTPPIPQGMGPPSNGTLPNGLYEHHPSGLGQQHTGYTASAPDLLSDLKALQDEVNRLSGRR